MTEDPTYIDQDFFPPPPPRPQNATFEDEDKSKVCIVEKAEDK